MAARFSVAGVDGEAGASVNAFAAVLLGAAAPAFEEGVASETFGVLAARAALAGDFDVFPPDFAPAALPVAGVGAAAFREGAFETTDLDDCLDDALAGDDAFRAAAGFAAVALGAGFPAGRDLLGAAFAGAADDFPEAAFGARAGFAAADLAVATLRAAGLEAAGADFEAIKSFGLAFFAGVAAFAGAFALGALPSSAAFFLGLFGGIPGRPLGAGCRLMNCAKIWRAKLGPVQGKSCQNYGLIFS